MSSGVYFCAYVPEPTMREGTGIEAIKQQVRIATGCMVMILSMVI